MRILRKLLNYIENIRNKKIDEKNMPKLDSAYNSFKENLKIATLIEAKEKKCKIKVMKCTGDGTGIQKIKL